MFKIKYEKSNTSKKAISRGNQIVLLLNGCISLKFENYNVELKAFDIFYLAKSQAYQIDVIEQFDAVKIYLPNKCDNQLNKLNERFIDINNANSHLAIANFLRDYQDNPSFDPTRSSLELIEALDYQILNAEVSPISDTRVLKIAAYIEENYNNRITASFIASEMNLNAAYLTTIFKKEIGLPLTKYINNVRLEAALLDIYYTNKSFTSIAYQNGFADVRTLNAMIKGRFEKSPSELREQVSDKIFRRSRYIIIDQYIDKYASLNQQKLAVNSLNLKVDATNGGSSKVNNNFNCFAIGRAFDILDSKIQTQIIEARSELNFKYCKFNNIFGDEMNCVNEDYHKSIKFNFTNAIKVLDFLDDNGIIPFVELGFSPKQICNQKQGIFSGNPINIGGDINFELWNQMIEEFGNVLIDRYGLDKIKMWRFEVGSEAYLEEFGTNSISDYQKLYKMTYERLKSISYAFKIGGFGVLANDSTTGLDKCYLEGQLKCDFVSIHSYPFAANTNSNYRNYQPNSEVELSYINNKLERDIKALKEFSNKTGVKEQFISSWNTTIHHREILNDQLFKAAAIVKEFINICESKLSGVCYWSLSDVMYEVGLSSREFHGGIGLITQSGIKKSAYHSFWIVEQVKGSIVDKGSNHLITKHDSKYQVLVHNNANLKRDYVNKIGSDAIKEVDTAPIELSLKLAELKPGNYIIKKYLICDENNPLQLASLLNINKYLKKDEVKLLKDYSQIQPQKEFITIDSNYNLDLKIKKNEVFFLEVENISKN